MPEELSPGERIRLLRESRGMSRTVLAGLCGRSSDWLKKIESGERELRSHSLLVRLAVALHVDDLSVITGDSAVPTSTGRMYHPAVTEVWAAIMERHALHAPADASPVQVDDLAGRVAYAWRLWHTSGRNRTEVGALLPDLIREAEAAQRSAEGVQRRTALLSLSAAYRLVGQLTAYIAPAELVWIAAERAMAAARDADDPAALAAAAWNLGNIMRETSRPEEAEQIVTEAAAHLRPHLTDDRPLDWRGAYGALHLHAAITAARDGRAGDAWRYWDAGNEVAKSLPQSYAHPSLMFGRANTDLHAVSVATDLRSASQAVDLADDIDPDAVPSAERRSRLWVEAARGHLQRGDRTATLATLKRAHAIAPETVSYTPVARSTAAELWRTAGRSMRAEATALAESIGVTPPN